MSVPAAGTWLSFSLPPPPLPHQTTPIIIIIIIITLVAHAGGIQV